MKHDTQSLAERQQDLDNLSIALRLLMNAAEAIQEANAMLQRAKHLASEIQNPELRRQAMAAAGELKATTGDFLQ